MPAIAKTTTAPTVRRSHREPEPNPSLTSLGPRLWSVLRKAGLQPRGWLGSSRGSDPPTN